MARKKISEQVVSQIEELARRGLSKEAIARKLGISRTTVARYLNPDLREKDYEMYRRWYQRKRRRDRLTKAIEDFFKQKDDWQQEDLALTAVIAMGCAAALAEKAGLKYA